MSDDDLRSRFRRDFTNEPIGRPRARQPLPAKPAEATPQNPPAALVPSPAAAHQPAPPRVSFDAPAHPRPQKQRKSRKKLLLTSLLIVIIAGGGAYWYKFMRVIVPVPASIRASAGYPLLYPSRLPAGYAIKTSSFTNTNGAVIFEADNSNGGKIVFSLQRRPATFDFPAFYKQGLNNASPFTTPNGEAAIGTANGNKLASFRTDQTWMLITSPSGGLKQADFKFILQNIKPAVR